MKNIYISGSTGFIGSHLSRYLTELGYKIVPVTRKEFALSPAGFLEFISPADIIINLAGAPIMKRWTTSYKNKIKTSRIFTTQKISSAIRLMEKKPLQFISVSAVGIYDDKGPKNEMSKIHDDNFLAELGKVWEDAALKASEDTVTTICRMGIVLGKNGGALKSMLPVFKAGFGGKIGSGTQMMSWIHLFDVMRAFRFIIENHLHGIYNFTAPSPVSNAELSKSLAAAVKMPFFFTVPTFALRLVYGGGAQVLTHGQEVYPNNLLKKGFVFSFPNIDSALQEILN